MYILGHSFFNKVYVHTLAILSSTRYMYILGHSFFNKVYVHTLPFFLQLGICTYLAILSSTR
jgi:hypothetical protein